MMEQLESLMAWSEPLLHVGQVLLIIILAWLLQRIVTRGITRLGEKHNMIPPEVVQPLRGVLRWLILGSALILVLERIGVSAAVLWTALTGFTAVAAIAFFAIWSVLSNMFCALLIFSLNAYRIGDIVEVMDAADKPGVKGRVVSINLFYVTLDDMTEEGKGAKLQIANSLFFQKIVRRWRGSSMR